MAGNVTLDNGTTQLLNTAMTLLPLVVVMAVIWVVVESIFNGRRQSRTFFTLVAAAGLLAYMLDIAPLWVVLVFVSAALAVWTVPPLLLTKSSSLSANLNTISSILEERECSKCDAVQIKLTTAEQRLERAMEDSALVAGQVAELATLKDGLRILRLRDGSERIIFTTDDEEDWYELYDELLEANKISNEVEVSQQPKEAEPDGESK